MSKILIAVSGGVDSVLLLDFLVEKNKKEKSLEWVRENIIIAHFEHGIRGEESLNDLFFVKGLALKYGLKFKFSRGNLGPNASEEAARNARYIFLRKIANKYNAVIFTAHHKNDLAETMVLNLLRGGGWRSIACLDSPDIKRPFLMFSKKQILEMATERNLEWREDSTNLDTKYTRNKIRHKFQFSDKQLNSFYEIWQNQTNLRRMIEMDVNRVLSEIKTGNKFRRDFFANYSEEVRFEVARQILMIASGKVPLSKQVSDFISKIKTYKNGSKTQILGGIEVRFFKYFFEIDCHK